MIKVFVNDKPIVLTTIAENRDDVKSYPLKGVSVRKVIRELSKTNVKEIRLVHRKEEKLLKKFLKLLPNVIAGGGKVYNDKGEILFIYRNDKWDLPKGKAERREPIDKAAVREVEEETGVKGVEIVKPLEITYHIFKRNGRNKIKITYWFEMHTSYDGPLQAQENEGITDVKWLNTDEISAALENSYANIKELMLMTEPSYK
ncbi:MAG: NUDIX domain-containing protein [Flavobacteriaceae bacterium]|nr:NUDIX domain-containing protein [Mangrovimonas sp.]MCB0436194.1 NUDIX domain-containing protein [Mangrovimonas sp.]HPF96949.1 NUDIX domain-containing protein [Mangrovimonas sp.]HRV55065.1 NUDIX domain-containing protein [Mangrovimonas sp.]